LLVTDGQPTYADGCVGDGTPTSDPAFLRARTDPIVAEIGDAFASGIKTVIVGLLPSVGSDCQLGWHFTDESSTEIEICGATRDRIKSDPEARLEVLFE
jgi:hypothetical protein